MSFLLGATSAQAAVYGGGTVAAAAGTTVLLPVAIGTGLAAAQVPAVREGVRQFAEAQVQHTLGMARFAVKTALAGVASVFNSRSPNLMSTEQCLWLCRVFTPAGSEARLLCEFQCYISPD